MYNIGIDLGGTNIKVGVVNDDFKIVGKSNIKTDLPRPAEEIADSIAKGVELACKEAGIEVKDINSIGITRSCRQKHGRSALFLQSGI